MSSSRIFIKGLPPSLTEQEFKAHFGAKHSITDAKLIPHRRIGYVGYKSPEDAAKAVKYFNRSFIRMSKIGVEIARPISDPTLPVSRKAQREQERENARARREAQKTTASPPALTPGSKRKRSDVDPDDHKLKEFLQVMQPPSKTKSWVVEGQDDSEEEPPTKIQAVEAPEADSDDEYEAVPKKPRKITLAPKTPEAPISESLPDLSSTLVECHPVDILADGAAGAADATDDDWLRSRTNRLLDLVEPGVVRVEQAAAVIGNTQLASKTPEELSGSDNVEPPAPEGNVEEITEEHVDEVVEAIKANGRLFVRNLSYIATEDDLRTHFESYGSLEEVHLPVDTKGASKGFALVQFTDPACAAAAYHNVDGEPFQGRLLHILPAAAKRENKLDEFAISKLPLKKQKQIRKKAEASTSYFNWNSLYMNPDAVNSSIAERLGVSKAALLDPTSADAGVKQAIAETTVILETKSFFAKNGVDLNAFKRKERGDTAILVKNFPYGMTLEELRKMFEEFGQVLRVLMPPNGTIAIVEFAQPTHARAAFASLAYRRIKDTVLFLEKAPKDLFTSVSSSATVVPTDGRGEKKAQHKISAFDLHEADDDAHSVETSTLFVRNLNFITTNDRLAETFKPLDGLISARVKTKPDPKKPGQTLSMGFGFLEFKTNAQAQAALKAMDGYGLDDHKLILRASHKGVDAAEERRKEDRAKKLAGKRTKIIIKNLPFEASKTDVRALFGTYGQLRSVRVPKNFDHRARGFAFAEFVTAREAENALEALKDTHLLGRRLVLEFAAGDSVDAEEEIAKMQKKVGSQVNMVALQNLTGGGRKKFNVDDGDADED